MTACPGKAGHNRHEVKTPGAPGVRAVPTGGARLRGWDCAIISKTGLDVLGRMGLGLYGLGRAALCRLGLGRMGLGRARRAMRPVSGLCLAVIAGTVGTGGALATPVVNGADLPVLHHDVIAEPPVYRYRFVLPDLGAPGRGYADLSAVMTELCADFALPHIRAEIPESEADPERVIVTLMSAPVEFGVMRPDVTQFFESFRVENDLCIWEAF